MSLYRLGKAYVYHMTCRGSRFKDGAKRNPDGQVFMKGRETDRVVTTESKKYKKLYQKMLRWLNTMNT